MPVAVLLIVAIILFVGLLLVADHAVKAAKRVGRRREARRRLSAATDAADVERGRRRAAADASGALTSLMPTIHEHEPRHVD